MQVHGLSILFPHDPFMLLFVKNTPILIKSMHKSKIMELTNDHYYDEDFIPENGESKNDVKTCILMFY